MPCPASTYKNGLTVSIILLNKRHCRIHDSRAGQGIAVSLTISLFIICIRVKFRFGKCPSFPRRKRHNFLPTYRDFPDLYYSQIFLRQAVSSLQKKPELFAVLLPNLLDWRCRKVVRRERLFLVGSLG